MFIVVYPVFHHIVYYVCFKKRSKMDLSCPHFILFPKGGGVKLRYFLLGLWPKCVYDTCRKIVLSIYFTYLNKLATGISRRVCYILLSI